MKYNFIHINEIEDIDNHISSVKNPILFVLKEGTDGFYGKIGKNFGLIMGNEIKGILRIIENFVKYESTTERTPVLFLLKNAQIIKDNIRKESDSDWLVHSTDLNSLKSIIKMEKLLSRIELDKQGIKYLDFGREDLNEPYDYYDFIEFGNINMSRGEAVVASKILKRFVNEDEEYYPGGRIYIEKEDLKKQNGYIEFLDHYCIKGTLELQKVKHEIISVEDFEKRIWTPKTFTEEADKLFEERIKNWKKD